MRKLAVIITHPIQYYLPLFQLLAKSCDLKVFYTWGKNGISGKYDPDFNLMIAWDIPLLDGYSFEILQNNSKDPGSHHFNGIHNLEIINRINLFNPDAILIYGWAFKSHLKVLRHFKGKIPICFRGDSTLLDERIGLKKFLRKLWLRWIYSHIDKAFYVGKNNKAYYKEFGLKEKQLIFAPHAVDNERFAEDRVLEARQLRQTLNIEQHETLILFAGKFENKKNPELLLQAFIELDLQNVHLLFVGSGELEERLKLRVEHIKLSPPPTPSKGGQNLSIEERVHFMDFRNQSMMPVVYQACDLFCLPSSGPGETWGLAVNEAMSAGKAILVSDKVGCAMDLVMENQNGRIFKSGDIDDLKNKLILLTNKPSKLTQMGNKSSAIIKNWTINKQAAIIINELILLNESK
ncbi:MAG: glycosyltransferase [Pedobacter sp.]|nr:MAG: glycosyltransferase [Pedobacter sp.]